MQVAYQRLVEQSGWPIISFLLFYQRICRFINESKKRHTLCTRCHQTPVLGHALPHNTFSEREHYMMSPIHLSSVCNVRSCAVVRRLKFSAVFLQHFVPWPSTNIHGKFYGDRPLGTPLSGELNTRRVPIAKDRDFGPMEGYILETVQDRT